MASDQVTLGDMNRRGWSAQHELLANSRDGAIRVMRLEELGVASCTAYRRCRPGGPWQRILPGVVLLHNGPVSGRQRVLAALLYGGSDAVVTGAEACRRYGLQAVGEDGVVHLAVPADRKVHSCGFVVVERTTRMPGNPVWRDGVPLMPVTRAVLDAGRRLTERDPCRALLTETVQRRMTAVEDLASELALGSSRGSAIPRTVLAEMSEGAHSVAEIDGARLWKRASLPPARWNGELLWPNGVFLAKPDAWVDEVALAWEIDSVTHHADPEGFQRTVARNVRYARAGIVVVQTLPSRLRSDPVAVVRELRDAYAAAAARPRPSVIFRPAATRVDRAA